ncbi:hypothetical protein GGU10DRAFT_381253 [Lentinula aff. detonsa]|uniref:Uncharacterized protein n=1 Tax=Lentinula aff. detonsa TaxID=2804958 RepID=A0AA38K7J5_9AGAR|nr:hypothetical protein GGU10DRAFT_381253 [Lentinula aff. detonsa]
MKCRGRPLKRKRDVIGLRNQPGQLAAGPQEVPQSSISLSSSCSPEIENDLDDEILDASADGSGDFVLDEAAAGLARWSVHGQDEEDEIEEMVNLDGLGLDNEDLQERLTEYAIAMGDDLRDENWLPTEIRRKLQRQKREKRSRPREYAKGPDVGSKSLRTQQRYKIEIVSNQSLTEKFGFTVTSKASSSTRAITTVSSPPGSPVQIRVESVEPELTWDTPALDSGTLVGSGHAQSIISNGVLEKVLSEIDPAEAWEEELDESIGVSAKLETQSWNALRDELILRLKHAKKSSLPLSQINQLLIL